MTTLTFSQGIVSHSTDTGLPGGTQNFLVINGDKVDLHAPLDQPLIAVFAHRDTNYLLTLQNNGDIQSWGYGNISNFNAAMSNLNGGGTATNAHHLWIGINRSSGATEYGHSIYEPSSGATPPFTESTRPNDIHWFDTGNNMMKVWRVSSTPGPGNYGKWVEVIRIFVAKYIFSSSFASLSINSPSFIGTMSGLVGITRAGSLIYDVGGKPILRTDSNNVSLFFTTEDIITSGMPVTASPVSGNRMRFETFIVDAIGLMPAAAYSMVKFVGSSGSPLITSVLPLEASTQAEALYGMIEFPIGASGDLVQVTMSGIVRNPLWNWTVVNQQIYVDKNSPGELATVEDGYLPILNQLPVGVALDKTTILLRRPELAFSTSSSGSGVSDHTLLSNIGITSHAGIDTHIVDGTIHFTEASIDHDNILNIGTNTHMQIDTHMVAGNIHFTEASISHLNITDIGTTSHADIDTHITTATNHIADGTIHFTKASINIGDLGDVDLTTGSPLPAIGDVLQFNGATWEHGQVAGGGGLNNVVEDLTPQLGGSLDVNGQIITSVVSGSPASSGDIDITSGNAPGASGLDGGGINISGGVGDGSGYGGGVDISAGDSYYGGSLQIQAGSGTYAGYIVMESGNSTSDDAGDIDIIAGNTTSTSNGGGVHIEGGANSTSGGGAIHAQGGSASSGGPIQLLAGGHGTGTGGNIILKPGTGQNAASHGKVYVMGQAGTVTPGELRIHTDANITSPDSTYYVGLTVTTMPASITYTLPAAPSVVGQVLTSTTGGVMSWTTPTGLDNIIEDTTPQLGGNLDVNGFDIISIGGTNIDITSSVGSSGPGGSINITTGDGDGSNPGGNLVISGGFGGNPLGSSAGNGAAVKVESGRGGSSTNYDGGDAGLLELLAARGGAGSNGNPSTGGDGGDIHMYAGQGGYGGAVSGAGGNINIFAGDGYAESVQVGAVGNIGGDVVIASGDGAYVSKAGDIILQPGQSILGADGEVQLRSSVSSTSGSVAFMDNDDSNSVTLAAPGTVSTNRTWVLPQDNPVTVAGQFLTTDASGNLSFTVGGTTNRYQETGAFIASTPKTITHSLGNKYVLVQIYDSNDDEIGPQLIHLVDANSLQITLNAGLSGVTVVVIG